MKDSNPFIIGKTSMLIVREGEERNGMLTKYVVGANAKPPKNPSSPPKKGKVMAMNIVNAAYEIT